MTMRYSQLDKKFTDEPPSMLDPTGREAMRNVANSGGELGREIQNQKHADNRLKKMANKAYRQASKSKDPRVLMQAYEFLEQVRAKGGSIGGGIQQAGDDTYKATQDALYARDQMTGQDSRIPGMGAGSLNPNRYGQSTPSGDRLNSVSNSNLGQQDGDSSLIRAGQGAFGEQGKIDKANSLLDKYTNDDNYSDEMLRRDAELMGADPNIAQEQAHKRRGSVLAEREKEAALAQSRIQANDIVTKFGKEEIGYDDALKQGLELGGKEESIKSRLDPIVNSRETKSRLEEEGRRAAEEATKTRNKEILGRDPTVYEKHDPNKGLEERMAKSKAERVKREAEIAEITDTANRVVSNSNDRQEILQIKRNITALENEERKKIVKEEAELMQKESQKLRSNYEKANKLGYTKLDFANPFSSNIERPFAPQSALRISDLNADIRGELNNRNSSRYSREESIKGLYSEVANTDKAFSEALGGKQVERDGVRYQSDSYSPLKKQALQGGVYAKVFHERLIQAAAQTGYPIELDKELMANEGFAKALNDYKKQEGINEPMTTYFPKYKKDPDRKSGEKADDSFDVPFI